MGRVGSWNKDLFKFMTGSGFNQLENAADRAEFAVQGELTDESTVGEVTRKQLARVGENRDGDGEIKVGASFLEVSRGEIDGKLIARKIKEGIGDGGANALPAFIDSTAREADDIQVW